MRIQRFRVCNYKIHKDTTLDLTPITVLVGPNGGGKSSLFDALITFSIVSRGPLSEAFSQWPHSFAAYRHHGSSHTARISYDVSFFMPDKTVLDYSIAFSDAQNSLVIHEETLRQGDLVLFDRGPGTCLIKGVEGLIAHDVGIFAALRRLHRTPGYAASHPAAAECARDVSRIARYRLEPANMRRPSLVADANDDGSPARTPRIGYVGEQLASVLFFLHEAQAPELSQITEQAAKALRGFEGFEFNRIGADRVGFSARFADSRGVVPAANLSDGSLSVLGWLTLSCLPDRPAILCVEEPENGMTPRALEVVYEGLRRVATDAAKPSQILVSSHSPFVVTKAWNGEDRDFIHQCYPKDGSCRVVKSSEAVADAGSLKAGGEIGLRLAEQVMDGFRGPS